MQKAGVKVLRTWVRRRLQCLGMKSSRELQGFNAINGSELAGAKESGLTYYQVIFSLLNQNISLTSWQVWNSNKWTLNDGPQGLQRLDHVIETAGKYGIKVILAFTNNW